MILITHDVDEAFRRQEVVRAASPKEKAAMLAEPTFQNVGLKQGRFVSRATHLDTILFSCLGFRPRTKVFINTHSLLPPAKLPFFVTLADRIILIEDGRVTMDQRISLPRPRKRKDTEFLTLAEEILKRVMGDEAGLINGEAEKVQQLASTH
jgi:sulfonate transport system ATP-binding protein